MNTFKNDLEKKINSNAKVKLDAKSQLININDFQSKKIKLQNYTHVKIIFEVDKSFLQ